MSAGVMSLYSCVQHKSSFSAMNAGETPGPDGLQIDIQNVQMDLWEDKVSTMLEGYYIFYTINKGHSHPITIN